jgi:hypothetical protein
LVKLPALANNIVDSRGFFSEVFKFGPACCQRGIKISHAHVLSPANGG